jgi:hypothetical protein
VRIARRVDSLQTDLMPRWSSANPFLCMSDFKKLKVWRKAHGKEFGRFIRVALNSAAELEYHLIALRATSGRSHPTAGNCATPASHQFQLPFSFGFFW